MMVKLRVTILLSFGLVLFLLVGASFLTVSFMCFHYIIPGFWSCGSACEYWWSWLIDFPRQGGCILMCVSRNTLYKPFFLIGLGFIYIAFSGGSYRIYQVIKRK